MPMKSPIQFNSIYAEVYKKYHAIAVEVGVFLLYLQDVLKQIFQRPFRREIVLQQIEFIGIQSLPVVLLTGFATGAVFGLQIGGIFLSFQAESLMGGATGIALATELAPLITGFLLTGRVGAAMAAEIATMVVNEQIDALESMGVHPIHYLVVPRVLASMFIMPFLCGLFMFIGVFASYIVGVLVFNVDSGVFYEKLLDLANPHDIVVGLRKMLFFAFLIAVISCRLGLNASKGAKGVGLATTNAVVVSLLAILCTDFLISFFQVKWMSS